MATERKERVIVTGDNDFAQKQRIVEYDVSAQQLFVSRFSQLIWLLVAILDTLLVLRFIMKLIAANAGNVFTNALYQITDIFVYPFQSIIATPDLGQGSVIDVSVIFAIVVYTFATLALVTLIKILLSDTGGTRNVTTYEHRS